MSEEPDSDPLGCPQCGSRRTERFTVGRLHVVTCADCGTHSIDERWRDDPVWDVR